MNDTIASYLHVSREESRWGYERRKLEKKAVEAWYDSLTPDQRTIFYALACNEELVMHVRQYASGSTYEQTLERLRRENTMAALVD